jgi:hypothetical protein
MRLNGERASAEESDDEFVLFALVASGVALAIFGLGFISDYLNFGSPIYAWSAFACIASGLFLAHLFRALQVWRSLRLAMWRSLTVNGVDPGGHAPILRKGLREPFGYAFVALFAVTGATLFGGAVPIPILAEIDLAARGNDAHFSMVQLLAAIGILLLAQLPVAVITLLHAKTEREIWFERTKLSSATDSEDAKPQLLRFNSISNVSFYTTCILTFLLAALAVWAAGVSIAEAQKLSEGSAITARLALMITFGVVAAFIIFIFLPHIQRAFDNWGDDHRGAPPNLAPIVANGALIGWNTLPAIASAIDSALVRVVAPLTGATQPGRGIPHLYVICTLLPVTALGFALPPPFGLIPISYGMLMVLALGRRWAWIEEDRETASRLQLTRSREIYVGFDNDLKDEALLGYASLFIIVPLALYQINAIIPAFTVTTSDDNSNLFFAWLSFFGAELAKAVPFVDWWEIYDVNINVPIEPVCDNTSAECLNNPRGRGLIMAGQHMTFAARAMVDLVIMAALFQAISIWQRSRAQERLYDAGHLNAFDPFTEVAFFKRGMRREAGKWVPSDKFERRVDDHVAKRLGLGLPPTPYSEMRLTELLADPDEEVAAGVRWMIQSHDILVGKPEEQLEQLVQQWQKAETLHHPSSKRAKSVGDEPVWRREQKPRIEAVVDKLLGSNRETLPKRLGDRDVANLMQLIRQCKAHLEFAFARSEIVEILRQCESQAPAALLALVAQTVPNEKDYAANSPGLFELLYEHFPDYVSERSREPFAFSSARFGWQDDRKKCYEAMSEIFTAYTAVPDHPVLNAVEDYLSHQAEKEGKEAKVAATNALEVVRSVRNGPPAEIA